MTGRQRIALAALCLALAGCGNTEREATQQAGVASAHPMATEAGIRVLESGGNAFDAAVATAATLGVVEPYSSGIGGGGFWVLRPADGDPVVIDARETAPGKAHPDLYLDEDGEVLEGEPSLNGALAAGIPGQPAALDRITGDYGNLPLHRNLAPAIKLARTGFPVDERYRSLAEFRLEVLREDPTTRRLFLDGEGNVPEAGTLIHQPALADTLRTLARKGRDGFYQGELAQKLTRDVRAAGGIWTGEDLAEYETIKRKPRIIDFRDARILTAPAPSSGGVALGQLFGMLQARPLPATADSVERTHWLTEMMRRAYRDRAQYLGDPAFTDIPTQKLLSPDYLESLASDITPDSATPSGQLTDPGTDGRHTSHLSVIDAQGNAVSATLSINYPFGSGVTSERTGIVLNNEMDDFSIRPGYPNAYGLIGGEANRVEAGKRPLSSMSPVILETDGAITAVGTPGGSRIITMNFLALLDLLDGHAPASVVANHRFHHQYQPDQIQHEPDTFTTTEKERLRDLGHELKDVGRTYGNMQLIRQATDTGRITGASDPRGIGRAGVIDATDSE
ncbi:gamma-glutamyltransferase 1 [Halospina denitrificans]|uniref:Glutathione hydrolase proenzyme n=1 Tax=Halospina denitrificans TaxID=332522 RepID=A0A4R7JQV6_9GAMM|nr:gamma-glutamyltransferase [Halospina denitrificans]TDT40315.1 gamma-glutamyltransferase 1 [Halospina denitrificans]